MSNNHTAKGDNRNFGCTTTNIANHVSGRFINRDFCTNGCSKGFWDNFYFRPSTCAAARGTNGEISKNYSVVTVNDQLLGQRWADAQNPYTMFYTILPPNAPTCAKSNENSVITTASSYHSGGVNVCMGDGAVRFVSDTVNLDVWAAASTSKGSETTNLD